MTAIKRINDNITHFPLLWAGFTKLGRESDLDICALISVVIYLSHICTCTQMLFMKIRCSHCCAFFFHNGEGGDWPLGRHHKAHCPPKVRSSELLSHPQDTAQVPWLWGPAQGAGSEWLRLVVTQLPPFPSPSSGPSSSPFSPPSPLPLAFPSCPRGSGFSALRC